MRAVDLDELDITDQPAVARFVRELRPHLIVNAAAYTAVDRAESEPDLARAVNAFGVRNLAAAARDADARLIQISTDFVFDGTSGCPYRVEAKPNPLSSYGRSKWEGEQLAIDLWPEKTLVVRTAWLYSAHGGNFVKTMLRLMGEKERLRVVADQVGTPTWAKGLADSVWKLSATRATGILHWSDSGVASWYDFAMAIQEEALQRKLILRAIPVEPIPSSEYPTPAARPPYSVLDKTETWRILGEAAPHWRCALRNMLDELLPEKPVGMGG